MGKYVYEHIEEINKPWITLKGMDMQKEQDLLVLLEGVSISFTTVLQILHVLYLQVPLRPEILYFRD